VCLPGLLILLLAQHLLAKRFHGLCGTRLCNRVLVRRPLNIAQTQTICSELTQ
jgi:hypothetical protein